VTSEKGAALNVADVTFKPHLFKESLRWIEADLDPATLAKVDQWRAENAAQFGLDAEKGTEENFPETHLTVLFGYCPAAHGELERVIRELPKTPFQFSAVVPLGPPGKQNAWGLKTDDEAIFKFLESTRNEVLDCQNPQYGEFGGWSKLSGTPFAILPYVTGIRNIKNGFDVNAPPPLGVMAGHLATLTCVRERIGLVGEQSGVKIKLVIDHNPQ